MNGHSDTAKYKMSVLNNGLWGYGIAGLQRTFGSNVSFQQCLVRIVEWQGYRELFIAMSALNSDRSGLWNCRVTENIL